ncbi:hypothetical protein BOTBODRAFT_31824 [Botryobasidium botryosum FD-172 SS1]|uniref:Vacuolar protein sorting-associated protein 41 n=1 Tax=Botryobasidium botryosum (strain FD-172 SS1) TaxID=930990 RepID=A0A067MLA3_BOTB1|nr:hypothetical protein BOTBODRAFT_31824 [Botryobasidium botryosum FD-172 SS1]
MSPQGNEVKVVPAPGLNVLNRGAGNTKKPSPLYVAEANGAQVNGEVSRLGVAGRGNVEVTQSDEDESDEDDSAAEDEDRTDASWQEKEDYVESPDDEDYDDDDDDNDDEEDDDEEPTLKYERLGGAAPEILEKDTASALAVSTRFIALGTHVGMVHVLDFQGNKIQSYRPHAATVNAIDVDATGDFVATASVDGKVIIHSLTTPEMYGFDFRRPMRCVALEPSFAKRSTRAFVCGGMSGKLVMHEKGWLGHRESEIHSGEGPIWNVVWRGALIAWANDLGVKIYDTVSRQRITFIDRPPDSPRADLFKCTIRWHDDNTLLIAWADHIKLARVRARTRSNVAHANPYQVEITAIFQVDGMISGLIPYPTPIGSFLVLAYLPPDIFANEATSDPAEQRRKAAHRPELRIIANSGEELTSDVLSLQDYHMFGCNDYVLQAAESFYIVLSPRSVVLVKPRDEADHVAWLVERKRYEEALEEVEKLKDTVPGLDAAAIGQQYIEHLVHAGEFDKAAKLCPKVFGQDAQAWENWIFLFAQKDHLHTIIPFVPTQDPQLSRLVYEMILAHYLSHDRDALLSTIKKWPSSIYDISTVIVAVNSELERSPSSPILMECLAELYIMSRQPGKALPFFLRLRRPHVFDLIREHNLFTAVRDQALLLVEFDQELEKKRREKDGETLTADGAKAKGGEKSAAITLLVDHTHSIPIARVVQQLQARPYYLYLYLDALFEKDPYLASEFSDRQVQLYAEFAPTRLIDFLRASNYYSLEQAYSICKERDLVPEMVFLLGRMGNNRQALNLIIERLGDVHRAIDFAKEQNDDDLWEDLLRYSETKPTFIRGLLENVGAEIDPIRLIRRIKNGLEIPGLKEALIKILWDFNLQISLLEGCQTILHGDCTTLAERLRFRQTGGFFGSAATPCLVCRNPLFIPSVLAQPSSQQPLILMFLCQHVVHATCVKGGHDLPQRLNDSLFSLMGTQGGANVDIIGGKIAHAAMVRARLEETCPVCHVSEGGRRIHARF